MTKLWLPRAPAYPGLWPDPPAFLAAPQSIRDWLHETFALKGDVRVLKCAAEPPCGYYRVVDDEHDCFIKVLREKEADTQRRAHELNQQLADAGAPVATPVQPVLSSGGYIGLVSKARNFRLVAASIADLSATGTALSRLHKALSNSSRGGPARLASRQRAVVLTQSDATLVSTDCYWLPVRRRLISSLDLLEGERLFAEHPGASMIHGDLNPANVLIDAETGSPTFVDFEDALVSWLPPAVDLATVLLRLVFAHGQEHCDPLAAGRAMLKAYHQEHRKRVPAGRELVGWMHWICWRNLCLLEAVRKAGAVSPAVIDAEVGKALALSDRAELHRVLIGTIADF